MLLWPYILFGDILKGLVLFVDVFIVGRGVVLDFFRNGEDDESDDSGGRGYLQQA